jgi:hypothetical protein
LTEREGAIFDTVRVLARTVLELGANPKILKDRLSEARQNAEALGSTRGADTHGFLIETLFSPSDPESKPTLRLCSTGASA